jgi:hypothetical protein
MPPFINIADREKLSFLLTRLEAGMTPLWGRLKAQTMIEHLIGAVEYTNGKKIAMAELPVEVAKSEKLAKVRDEFEIPRNVTGPLPDNSNETRYKDLQTAINALNKEIDTFEHFFETDGQTAVHFAFGPMNHKEWILWHGKHFAHHFKQFGLLD